jgi:hypothetical protein
MVLLFDLRDVVDTVAFAIFVVFCLGIYSL